MWYNFAQVLRPTLSSIYEHRPGSHYRQPTILVCMSIAEMGMVHWKLRQPGSCLKLTDTTVVTWTFIVTLVPVCQSCFHNHCTCMICIFHVQVMCSCTNLPGQCMFYQSCIQLNSCSCSYSGCRCCCWQSVVQSNLNDPVTHEPSMLSCNKEVAVLKWTP